MHLSYLHTEPLGYRGMSDCRTDDHILTSSTEPCSHARGPDRSCTQAQTPSQAIIFETKPVKIALPSALVPMKGNIKLIAELVATVRYSVGPNLWIES